MIEFTWDIIYRCNYRCSYCWWDPQWEAFEKEFPSYPPAEDWIAAWERVREKHGKAMISVLGGEPFVYPGFPKLLSSLSRAHQVCVTTNLSTPEASLFRMAEDWDPASIDFGVSYHPEFADWGEFLGKVAGLQAKGFRATVRIVAHPSYWDDLARYQRDCQAASARYKLLPFNGTYEGRRYPAAYTPEQRAWLGQRLPDAHQGEYIVEQRRTFGKLCHAGRVYANVKSDGQVFRCGGAGGKGYLGNLLDTDFTLYDAARACPVEHCVCEEYVYLDELFKKEPAKA